MYNRYIPQPDGSYQRNRMPEPVHSSQQKPPNNDTSTYSNTQSVKQGNSGDNILGFFKNLLPKSMDTGDLIIVLLLLLMANDCEKDRNHALLTLALYFLL